MNLVERIDHWALAAPNAIAHISGDRALTYGELRRRSNALAAHLVERFGDDRAPIAVLGHREPEMLIAFLGAAKSRRPYVPLDTALPPHRIDKILAISRPVLLLTPEEISKLSASAAAISATRAKPHDPFYILFTSGSTGEPKGVIITLGCLEHFVGWMLEEQKFFLLGETFLNTAPFSFDLSVMDLYCSLATGGTLFSVSRDLVANPKMLYRALGNSGATTWVSTPSFVQMCLVEERFAEAMLPRIRRFLFCGEILAAQTAARLLERFPQARVWNTYGPTEATVATTSVRIDHSILERYSELPVGRPMPGTNVFVVNGSGRTLPENKRGEIIIAGPNVSPGYLGRPDLTKAVFFEHSGRHAYRTGDQGEFRDDLLFFEGRMDSQVKISGYRIEVGDVEANLSRMASVRDAVVIPVIKNSVAQSLAAFVVLNDRTELSDFQRTQALRRQLGERLPEYMLPRKFVFLDALPLTANGKADRARLAQSL
ncbi:MAG: D-alanine--poly(phosphoribitol) ligase subunit DltA [Verrucomicrobia bacterium]|nr:D-alanine--poly(phosphoribitol) ligase subunit DltA [Verrucomicrobiota bacterium]